MTIISEKQRIRKLKTLKVNEKWMILPHLFLFPKSTISTEGSNNFKSN